MLLFKTKTKGVPPMTHTVYLRLDVPLSSPLALRFYPLGAWMREAELISRDQYMMRLNEGPFHMLHLMGVRVCDFEAWLELMQEHFSSGDKKTKEWIEALVEKIKDEASVKV
jgi:hypothetical protein